MRVARGACYVLRVCVLRVLRVVRGECVCCVLRVCVLRVLHVVRGECEHAGVG